VALVRLLLERGADRSVRTAEGDTPLDIATKNKRAEVVRLLGGGPSPRRELPCSSGSTTSRS